MQQNMMQCQGNKPTSYDFIAHVQVLGHAYFVVTATKWKVKRQKLDQKKFK